MGWAGSPEKKQDPTGPHGSGRVPEEQASSWGQIAAAALISLGREPAQSRPSRTEVGPAGVGPVEAPT